MRARTTQPDRSDREKSLHADVAQLVEHLVANEEVAGSSPAISSIYPRCEEHGYF